MGGAGPKLMTFKSRPLGVGRLGWSAKPQGREADSETTTPKRSERVGPHSRVIRLATIPRRVAADGGELSIGQLRHAPPDRKIPHDSRRGDRREPHPDEYPEFASDDTEDSEPSGDPDERNRPQHNLALARLPRAGIELVEGVTHILLSQVQQRLIGACPAKARCGASVSAG